MRWHILKTLLRKEVLRHLANRGGLLLVVLLLVAALLLSYFGGDKGPGGGTLAGGVRLCYIDYWERDDWVEYLIEHTPPELESQVLFRHVSRAPKARDGTILYPQNTGGIQLRKAPGQDRYLVWVWHPGRDGSALAVFEAWLWKTTRDYEKTRTRDALARLGPLGPAVRRAIPEMAVAEERTQLRGGLDPRSGIATSLVMFGLFFVCVYLLPSLGCEERERGVLLAQALSPAAPREILAAKFLFYPVLALVLGAVLGGTYNPAALLRPFFWLALLVAVAGSMGIGLAIASIARTQRAASMGAMCYLMGVGLILFICQQNNIPFVGWLALEYHCPRMLHAALSDAVQRYHWLNLAGAALLACVWAVAATILFRRRGWQT